jgi:hypothetical protein
VRRLTWRLAVAPVFVGPIGYVGHQALATDLANFKTALSTVKAEEGFITAVAPGSFARRQNQYYKSDERGTRFVNEKPLVGLNRWGRRTCLSSVLRRPRITPRWRR